jgi:alkylhydroperoxidase family enzyme
VTPDGQRVAPGGLRDVGLRAWVLAHGGGVVNGIEPVQLFLVLGKHRRLFRGWLGFARRLMPFGRLPRRESELVILRVAHLAGSTYEHNHHVRIGRRFGVTAGDVARLHAYPGEAEGWSPREAAILAAVQELHHDRDLSDAAWARLADHLDERERIELCLLAGHYEMLATTIAALRLQPERPRRSRRMRG